MMEKETKFELRKIDTKVLVAKAESFTSEVLGSLLKREGFDVVGRAMELDDVIQKIRVKKPSFVITDAAVVNQDPHRFTDVIAEGQRKTKVILYFNSKDPVDLNQMLQNKFNAYLHVDDNLSELYSCLGKLSTEETFYSTCFRQLINRYGITEADSATQQKIALLTKREKEVLFFITEGYTGQETATMLNMSYRTLANHKQNITDKFKLKSSRDLLKEGLQIRSFL